MALISTQRWRGNDDRKSGASAQRGQPEAMNENSFAAVERAEIGPSLDLEIIISGLFVYRL